MTSAYRHTPVAPGTANRSNGGGPAGMPEHRRPTLTASLCRSANILRHHLERTVLAGAGLSWTTFDILQLIVERQAIEPRTAAAEAGVSKATLTGAIRTLTVRNLIRRVQDPRDHRKVLLRPTATGWETSQRLRVRMVAEEARLLRRRVPAVPATAAAVLRRLAEPPTPAATAVHDAAAPSSIDASRPARPS